MRHGVKKIKFNFGIDANQMMMRQLASNFLLKGKISTTLKRAKILKSYLEQLIEKSKIRTEANKNYLLAKLEKKELIDMLFDQVGPVIKDVEGGYIRVVRLGDRDSDGARTAKVEWVYPVVIQKDPTTVKVKKGKPSESENKEKKLQEKNK